MKGDCSGAVEVLPDEDLPEVPVEVRHFDAVFASVSPVDVSVDIVDGNAVSRVERVDDDIFDVCSVQICTTYAVKNDVRPVDFACEKIFK